MMICSICNASKDTKPTKAGNDRLPRGWKRHTDVYCAKCWSDLYVLRAITMPVLRPLGEGLGWKELREALRDTWAETTAATNWMMTQLYTGDEQRNGQEKLPKMEPSYLYPETRKRFPRLPSQVCASLENSIKSKYRKKRYEVIWTCESSLPNARYPQPAIAPGQAWKPCYVPAGKDGGDDVPCVSVPLIDGQRWILQLRGGREFGRQLSDFKMLVSGQAIKGELAILRKRADKSRNGVAGRDSGGQKSYNRVMVKMVGWFTRTPQTLSGTMHLRTDKESFLVALDDKEHVLRLWHSDHVRRWIRGHWRRLQRLSDDQKAEQRPQASFQSRRESSALKFRDRIDSHIKETCAQVAGVAIRRRMATVRYDDTCRDYFGSRFDWSGFKTYLEQRLNQNGITLEYASGDMTPGTQEPLAGEKEHEN